MTDNPIGETLSVTRLGDYRLPDFKVKHHELHFALRKERVVLTHRQEIHRRQVENGEKSKAGKALVLNGEKLRLEKIFLDGRALDESAYRYENDLLTLYDPPKRFTLTTQVLLHPDENLALSGLYRSNGIYCTQCEAEGFRRISFTLDRPDVLATYRVRIEGDKATNPVLLSNGNLEAHGELPGARHYTQWYDPHPKPSYLFALVAGELSMRSKRIVTPRGKEVELCFYAEEAFIGQIDYAMQALIDAFVWEEKRFHLSYDLKRFNVVAIGDFNMGAMENKSLNIFNTRYVLASPDTASDKDFHDVQSVIGHEYFHNWTGNRITCRDWFQLSLKEGLTVFRDQEFSADMNERDIERIADVNALRRVQFAEDAGPLRHPVQPQEYAAIDNFYTATVYEKGAEIIRMYHTLIGEETFQKGMRLYTERHDGQAVRIEEFAQCMEEVSAYPFTGPFFSWYTTAGTPKVTFRSAYDRQKQTFTLIAHQDLDAVEPRQALVIPIRFSLLERHGGQHRFADGGNSVLLLLDREQASWTYKNIEEHPIPVLMQGFSAPVYYHYDYSDAELAVIVHRATDGFARFEAMQMRLRRLLVAALKNLPALPSHLDEMAELMQTVLAEEKRTPREKALLLEIPPLAAFLPHLEAPLAIDETIAAHERITHGIACRIRHAWGEYLANDREKTEPRYSVRDAGIRALRAVAMKSLGGFADETLRERLYRAYHDASCMSERLNALEALNRRADSYCDRVLEAFYARFAAKPLVIDKWFALQARGVEEDGLERIRALAEHEAFSRRNPNRFRALIATLIHANPRVFHRADGAGYRFVIAEIRGILLENPQLAARLLGGFDSVARLDTARKACMKRELEPLLATEGLGLEVREVIERILRGIE